MKSETPPEEGRRRGWRLSRDLVLFISGLLGVAHETLVTHGERPSLLILFAGMMGLPVLLRKNGI